MKAGAYTEIAYSSAHDGANRVSQVSGVLNGASTNYALSIAYAPHGALAGWQFGNINPVSAGLNVWRGYGYNSRLQLTAVWDTVALNPSKYLFAEVLNWGTTNNNGNVLSSSVQASPPGALGAPPVFPASYTYDSVNRLQSAAEGTTWNQTYNHDAFGNMWESTSGLPANGTRPTANIYTTANRMNNATYDAAGNQTTVPNLPGASQAYDAENRIVTVTGSGTTTYAYDGDGHRVQKIASAGTTNYVYDAFGNLVAEYNTAAAPAAPCLTCYLSTDHLGSVRMITDQAGNVVSRHDYTPFGEEIPAGTGARTALWGATDNVSQKFTGKERDQESGLDYFGARYYGSSLGRFTSPDDFNDSGITDPSTGKVIFSPGPLPYADIENPQSLNKYTYVLNNPLRYTDPDGHCIEDACVVEIGVAIAVGEGISGSTIAAGLGTLGGAIANILGGGSQMTPYGIGPNTGLYASQMSANKPGTLGKPDHQQTANEEAEKMGGDREVTIKTPGGNKESRRADAAKVDENKKVTEVTQVYRPTKGGNIPKREVDAANDIQNATGVKPNMVPVRPVKPPCTNSGGTCSQ